MDGSPSRPVRIETYAIFLLLFSLLLFFSHLPLIGLNYFWDEVEQYVPSALDIYHGGDWIPRSATPGVHPPGVMAYLAGFWKLAGYHPESTRSALLLLSSFGVLVAFLLAIELSKQVGRGAPAFLATGLLCCSPIFFAQSMLANLDAPAMVFTCLALLLFLQERIRACAAVCVVLVLVKETGLIVPLVFVAWLAGQKRWRDAAWFGAPVFALAVWLGALYHATGYWTGSPGFEQYNVFFPLHPVRLLVALSRRVYSLFFASFQWIGTAVIVVTWRSSRLFQSRPWKIAWSVAGAHVLLVTMLGGAVLTRYLLPIMPIVFSAMAAGMARLPRRVQYVCGTALLAGLAASNFINPPYQFPYEDNLAFVDFVNLQTSAAAYIDRWYGDAKVTTAWPLTRELSRPELGYVSRRIEVVTLRNFTPQTLQAVDWNHVDVFVAFSRTWDPQFSLNHFPPIRRFWQKFYGFTPNSTMEALRLRVPFELSEHFEKRGQWVEIYVNPRTPRRSSPAVRAMLEYQKTTPRVSAFWHLNSRLLELSGVAGGHWNRKRLIFAAAEEFEQEDHLVFLVGRTDPGRTLARLLVLRNPVRQLSSRAAPPAGGFQNRSAYVFGNELQFVAGKAGQKMAGLGTDGSIDTRGKSGYQGRAHD